MSRAMINVSVWAMVCDHPDCDVVEYMPTKMVATPSGLAVHFQPGAQGKYFVDLAHFHRRGWFIAAYHEDLCPACIMTPGRAPNWDTRMPDWMFKYPPMEGLLAPKEYKQSDPGFGPRAI